MVSDIVREIDLNFALPEGLKGVVAADTQGETTTIAVVDVQNETLEEEDSELDEDEVRDDVQPPDYINVLDPIFRTSPDGHTVVDIYIEVEDIAGAVQYDVRVTTA